MGAGAVGLASLTPTLSARAETSAAPASESGAVLLPLFNNEAFNGQISFCLGGASSHTAEIGEVMRAVQQINKVTGNPSTNATTTADFDTLISTFVDLGDRQERLAGSAGRGERVTYRQRMMRASSYMAQSLFFVLGGSSPNDEAEFYRICQRRWLRSAEMFERPVEPFSVPSRYGEIPCYFFPSPVGSGPRPTLIVSSGSDGQLVECMTFGVTDGLERGYNVVLFEGPGQMKLLFEDEITFTPDWNHVVGPILDAVRQRNDVGRVGLVGVSFGGMLSSRAAAKLDLAATVLMPAAWNMTYVWADQKDMNLVKKTHRAPEKDKQQARKGLNEGFAQAWSRMPRTAQWTFYKRGEIFSRKVLREARAGQPVSDYYSLLENMLPFVYSRDYAKITRPIMLTRNQGDQFFNGGQGDPPTPTTGRFDQPNYAYNLLESVPKKHRRLVNFTTRQGASLHDQPLAPQWANEVMFGWLGKYLR